MCEVFGVKENFWWIGIIEVEGILICDYMKDISQVEQEMDFDFLQEWYEKCCK